VQEQFEVFANTMVRPLSLFLWPSLCMQCTCIQYSPAPSPPAYICQPKLSAEVLQVAKRQACTWVVQQRGPLSQQIQYLGSKLLTLT